MATHPNRSKSRSSKSNPTPAEIRAARMECDLEPKEAAALIHCTEDAWRIWESGERRMHPAFFELFKLKAVDCRYCLDTKEIEVRHNDEPPVIRSCPMCC